MAWIMLSLAGLAEVVWAVGMKYSEGFTRVWPSVITVIFMVISVVLLALAMRTLPLGTAYAIWTGIGAIGAFVVGILWFNEPATAVRIGCALLILTGLIGLKLTSTA